MKRKILDLGYYPEHQALAFTSEDIQYLISNNIPISDIDHFFVEDHETYELITSDHLLENATSILKIVREEDNNLYWGYSIELKNGFKIKTDLNVTYILAPSQKLLFDYCAFIFTHLGQDAEECKRLIISDPNQSICLTSRDETDGAMNDDEDTF